jgi:hypothetical protein
MHYQRILAALPAIVAVAAGCPRAKPTEVQVTSSPSSSFYRIVPSPGLAFARSETPSSACPHASGTRSGRVDAAPRRYASLSPVARLDDAPHGADEPRFIELPPRGDAVVLERPGREGGAYEVRHPSGGLAFDASLGDAHVLARDEALYVGGRARSWSGVVDPVNSGIYVGDGGELLAAAAFGDEMRTLAANRGLPSNGGRQEPDHTTAQMERLHGANSAVRLRWVYTAKEPSVGAIDGAAQTVVALPSGHLVVLAAQGDLKTAYAIVSLDVPIDAGATDLSIVPPFALVLYGGGDAGSLVQQRSPTTATSRLDARRPDGTLAWRASLPFLATQPALDGDERVYVVGAGIAALDLEGHTLWSSSSTVPLRAAAFADGTLALVRGSELQIAGIDGVIRQSFRAAEELTTYPAIAADGAVWVASAKTLYTAR